jgi:hypothetical protein
VLDVLQRITQKIFLLTTTSGGTSVRNLQHVSQVCEYSFQLASTGKEKLKIKLNCVALVPEQTILTERPPLVTEVSANFCGYRVLRGQRNGSPRPYSPFSRPESLLFRPNRSSIVLTRLSGPRSRPTTFRKIW